MSDRAHSAWRAMQAVQDPLGLYSRTYRARVVAQAENAEEVDVRPDDPRLPEMAKIPLRHGVPGLRVWVGLGSYLLVGWDDGRPDRAFAALWSSHTKIRRIAFVGDDIRLASLDADQAFVRGTAYRAAEDEMLAGLEAGLSMMGSAAQGSMMALQPGIARALSAVQTFKAKAAAGAGFLSPKVKGP
jgi:hypothetical protein